MKSIAKELNQRVRDAMKRAGAKGDPLLKPSQDAKFGDYQSNCAMGVAKRLHRKPRDVADDIVAATARHIVDGIRGRHGTAPGAGAAGVNMRGPARYS